MSDRTDGTADGQDPPGALIWWLCPACRAEKFWIFDVSALPATFTERCARQDLEVRYELKSITIDDGRGRVLPWPDPISPEPIC